MNSYQVPGPPDHAISRIHLLVAALIAAAVMAVSLAGISIIAVAAEGAEVDVPLGTTVSEAVDSGAVTCVRGNVLSQDGDIVVYGGGEPGIVYLNGVEALGSERLADGDELVAKDGADVVEAEVTGREPIRIPVTYEGEGALVAIASPGAVGVSEVTRGAISGYEIERTTISEAEPMVLRRYAPDPGEMVVALTFDDGPWPLHTQQVLEILEREDAKATFFVLGKQVRRYRDMVVRIADEGHLVGNHSLSHVYMSRATPELARSEIENTQAEIEKSIGERPGWYRPAGGIVSPAVWTQTRESKVRLITWTVDPQDYRCESPVVLANRVIDSVVPGSVVLLHDGGGDRTVTVKALTTIIRELKSRGYTFVTLDELYDE